MSYIYVNHKVKDFNTWKPFFDNDIPEQKKSGIQISKLFCTAGDRNNVHILFETNNLEKAQQFFSNPRLKELMHTAGVISEPDVRILELA